MNIIVQYLSLLDIWLDADLPTTKRIFEEVGQRLEQHYGVPATSVTARLWRRELVGTTALGHGVTLPRARLFQLTDPVVAFVRSAKPLPFGAWDEQPVSHFLILLAPPPPSDKPMHILTLAISLFPIPSSTVNCGVAA